MKSKTQILTICTCILVTLFSCKKDNSQPASSESSSVDDAAVDLSSDSTLSKGLVAWFPFNADTKDYGIVWANNSEHARMIIAKQLCSNINDIAWVMGCLTAKKVR